MSGNGLTTWLCTTPKSQDSGFSGPCDTRNLWDTAYCPLCGTPRPRASAIREALTQRKRTFPIDLEDFLLRYLAQKNPCVALVHVVGDATYLEMKPERGDPRVWLVEENKLTPADSFGRISW